MLDDLTTCICSRYYRLGDFDKGGNGGLCQRCNRMEALLRENSVGELRLRVTILDLWDADFVAYPIPNMHPKYRKVEMLRNQSGDWAAAIDARCR
jgi:hypothetical protein